MAVKAGLSQDRKTLRIPLAPLHTRPDSSLVFEDLYRKFPPPGSGGECCPSVCLDGLSSSTGWVPLAGYSGSDFRVQDVY